MIGGGGVKTPIIKTCAFRKIVAGCLYDFIVLKTNHFVILNLILKLKL